ncbi:MAG: endonuclease [Hyphomicrobiales bacterium]|nr:endonuclease [Hyphomicrobiales bacterium]MDE2016855.1 endonuclease [Hyphomicrobiales bacterium]
MVEPPRPNRYRAIIERIFLDRWTTGATEFEFGRDDIVKTAAALGVDLPKNLGDVIYSLRYRDELPDSILTTEPPGQSWSIEGAGRAVYRFKLAPTTKIAPNPSLATIPIPDATPQLIVKHAFDDEQALLAIVRYNRLIDIFVGLTTYSLQNHLRTSVRGIGQIEIDELYVGIDKRGGHYVIPVQAKGGSDEIGSVQAKQDIAFAAERFPDLRCRAIAAQFMPGRIVALFELAVQDDAVKVIEERHYKLVPASDVDAATVRRSHD